MNQMDIKNTDLNLLKVFEALHDEGSASRAALRLGLTQPAISAALGRLRTVYGDQLFLRTGRGLAPTLLANQLKPVVTEALNKCRQSLAMVTPGAVSYEGRSVTIGLSDDFEIAIGRRLIGLMESRAAHLRLIFRQTHSQIVSSALMDRSVDLAIASGGFSSRALSRQLLGEGSYACLVDASSLRSEQAGLSIDQFITREHILISSGGFIGIVDEALSTLDLGRRVIASTTHFAALPYLLKGSNAVATVPEHAARAIADLSGLRMLPCPLSLPRYPIELGWRTSALVDTAALKVKQALVDCIESL
ncbi:MULTISPECIES: LysR family transcriptional regulator [Pseudomonas]